MKPSSDKDWRRCTGYRTRPRQGRQQKNDLNERRGKDGGRQHGRERARILTSESQGQSCP